MLYYRILILPFFFLTGLPILSAQPDWTVIPNDFEFTMTVTGVVVVDCEESYDENDMVGAFINGEARGVQAINTDIEGRKFAYMIIYDNDFNQNEITFRIYDASMDSIFDAQQSLIFSENAIFGNADEPFIFNTEYNLINTFLSQDSIDENALAGSVVGELNTVNELQDTFSISYDFVDDSFGPDNHYFMISDSLLILAENIDPEEKSRYQIHISGSTSNGCGRDDIMILHVTGQVITAVNETGKLKREEILIYPNPATTSIHFATEKRLENVSIYSLDGIALHDFRNFSTLNTVDISFLRTGLYLVGYYVDGVNSIRKLIVQ